MKVKPRFDAAIVAHCWGFCIYLAEIPDAEIVASIVALTKHNGILFHAGTRDSCGYIIEASELSPTHKEPLQRLCYWLKVSPVFDVLGVAKTFSSHLEDSHGFSTRLINEIPEGKYDIEESSILRVDR